MGSSKFGICDTFCHLGLLQSIYFKETNSLGLKFLKNHPFAVEAFFESSVVLSFAIPKQELESYIPECLELDTFDDQWGFVAAAMVQTKGLRPKGFPKFLGNDFFLIGFRIFVKYKSKSGKIYRGLYIIKSETDKKKMEFFGNMFTHYNYSTTDINIFSNEEIRTFSSEKSKLNIVIEQTDEEIDLPSESPFEDWKAARKFAGPLPFTFTYNETDKTVLIIQGVRQNWKPKPIKIKSYQIDFIDQLKFKNIKLANAFEINNIPYYWKKGRREQWS